MSTCTRCGKETNWTSKSGYCEKCAAEVKEQRASNDESRAETTIKDSEKDFVTTLLLAILLGIFGAHRFYAGKIGTGIIWLLTGGVFGIGWIIDIILVASSSFMDINGSRIVSDSKKQKQRVVPVAVVGDTGSPVEQLEALARLKASGVITEDEYNGKKAILLEKIK